VKRKTVQKRRQRAKRDVGSDRLSTDRRPRSEAATDPSPSPTSSSSELVCALDGGPLAGRQVRAERSELTAYELGVRLKQSRKLVALFEDKFYIDRGTRILVDAWTALDRLSTGLNAALREISEFRGDVDFGRVLIETALNCIRPLVRGERVDAGACCHMCRGSLESLQRAIESRFASMDKVGWRVAQWFLLGCETPNGEWIDPHNVPPRTPPKEGRARWVFDHPETVQDLLRQLKLSEAAVLADQTDDEPSIWSDDLPRFLIGWEQLEAGLRRLRRSQSETSRSKQDFQPNEQQQIILRGLKNCILTTEELAALDGIKRRQLFDDRKGDRPGHLTELTRVGLVKNLRKEGRVAGPTAGYYRPDAPPRGL
jgi:hypothetical protein